VKGLLTLGVLLALAVPAAAAPAPAPAPFDWWPVPSPDGMHIALTRVSAGRGTTMTLEVLDLRTRRLTVIGSSRSRLDPAWSHDGSQLAYASGGVLRVSTPVGTARHRYLAPTKAFAPAWRPNSSQLAYLTTHGAQNTDLWVAGKLWARDVIGTPAWSPDGSAIAFQRVGGIYVAAGPSAEKQVASIANPGPPAWSHDGTTIAFSAASVVSTVPADGLAAPKVVGQALGGAGLVSWRFDDARLAVAFDRGVAILRLAGPGTGGQGTWIAGASGPGVAYLAGSNDLLVSGSVKGCGGRVGILVYSGGKLRRLTGCG
jgi:Tol biopolymer transport system component